MSDINFFIKPVPFLEVFPKAGDDRPNPRHRRFLKELCPIDTVTGVDLYFFAVERIFCSLTAHLVTIHGQPYAHEHAEVQYYFANESFNIFNANTPVFTQGYKLVKEELLITSYPTKYCHVYGDDQPVSSLTGATYVGRVDPNYKKINVNEIYRDSRHTPTQRSDEHIKQLGFHDRVYHSIPHAPGMNFDEGKNMMSKFDIHEVKSEFGLIPFYFTKLEKASPKWITGWNSPEVYCEATGIWEDEGFMDRAMKSLKGIKDYE